MRAVWCFVIINFILFVPISIANYSILDWQRKKLYFSFCVYVIPIAGGYCTNDGFDLFIHFCNKRARLVNLKNVLKDRKGFSLKGVQLHDFHLQARCGFQNFNMLTLLNIFLLTNQQIMPLVYNKFPYLRIKNDLTIQADENIALILKAVYFTNLFNVIMIIIKTLIERMVKNVKRKK